MKAFALLLSITVVCLTGGGLLGNWFARQHEQNQSKPQLEIGMFHLEDGTRCVIATAQGKNNQMGLSCDFQSVKHQGE